MIDDNCHLMDITLLKRFAIATMAIDIILIITFKIMSYTNYTHNFHEHYNSP